MCDNTTAVAYINKKGGIKSNPCNKIAIDIWQWCITHNLYITAVHIPGKLNVEADRQSRLKSDNTEC